MLPETIKTNADLHLAASRSRSTLQARMKALTREHADRIKRIGQVMKQIESCDPHAESVEGLSSELSLSEDLEMLIVNPTHGL